MRAAQITCDECGKVVSGKNGTADAKEDYITIKGRITLHEWDEDRHDHVYTHATQNAYEENMFCSVDCLQQFIDHRTKEHKERPGKERLDRALRGFDRERFPTSRPSGY